MKKIVCVLTFALTTVLVGSVDVHASATLNWGCSSPLFAYQANGSTPINGDASSALAGFVQLIYIGGDGYDGYTPVGDGHVGNDVVVQSTWVGNGVMSFPDGRFLNSYVSNYAIGSQFAIRFFENPSPSFAAGSVPITGNYGLSQTYSTTADPNGGGQEDFFFNANYSAMIPVAVPEPTTVALMLAGLAVLAGRRFVRS